MRNQDAGGRDISIDYDHLDEVWAPFTTSCTTAI